MYFEYTTDSPNFNTDIEDSYFDDIRELNEQDEMAAALSAGDLNAYYTAVKNFIGQIEVNNEVIPEPEERYSIYAKIINYFILADIDPLEYLSDNIPEGMFYGCDFITSITLPNNIRNVKNFAFSFCANLRTLNLDDNLQTLASWIILGTRINGLNIPDNFRVSGCSSTCFFTGNGFGNSPQSLQHGLHFSSPQKQREFWDFEANN